MQKIYIDTNILVAYISGTEDPFQFPKAKQIFEAIRHQKFIGVISTLTLIELKGVLRTIIGKCMEQLKKIEASKRGDYVKNQANELFNQLVRDLLQLPNIKFEKGRQTNFQSILDSANEIMDDIKGVVKFYDNCGNCKANYKNSKHKQILAADILHVLLAMDTSCDSLLTFDTGFNALVGSDRVGYMQIEVK